MAGFNTISLKLKEMYQVCEMINLDYSPSWLEENLSLLFSLAIVGFIYINFNK